MDKVAARCWELVVVEELYDDFLNYLIKDEGGDGKAESTGD